MLLADYFDFGVRDLMIWVYGFDIWYAVDLDLTGRTDLGNFSYEWLKLGIFIYRCGTFDMFVSVFNLNIIIIAKFIRFKHCIKY